MHYGQLPTTSEPGEYGGFCTCIVVNFPLPVNLVTNNKGSAMTTLVVGARNGHTRVGEFSKGVSHLVTVLVKLNRPDWWVG